MRKIPRAPKRRSNKQAVLRLDLSSITRYFKSGLPPMVKADWIGFAASQPWREFNGGFIHIPGSAWYYAGQVLNLRYSMGYSVDEDHSTGPFGHVLIINSINVDSGTGLITGSVSEGGASGFLTDEAGVFYISPPGQPTNWEGQPKRVFIGWEPADPLFPFNPIIFSFPDPYYPTRPPGQPYTFWYTKWERGAIDFITASGSST